MSRRENVSTGSRFLRAAPPYCPNVRDAIVDWVESVLPAQLAVLFLGMLPIFELRLAIPVAREVFQMGPFQAYFWAVVGNLIPIPFILYLLDPVTAWAESHWDGLHRLISRLQDRTRRKHQQRFERLRDLAIITFVAIPLPLTGAWTGALAANVFGIEPKKAFGLIAVGVMIAGVIVSVAYQTYSTLS